MIKYSFDWKENLMEVLESTNYCSIATFDENGVWVNPVYFAWDSEFNFYFISMMLTKHMQNIKENGKIAVAIYKTEQKGQVIGVQLEGKARILENEQERLKAHNIYYRRKGSLEQNKFAMHDPKWLFVKISPEQIYYFNSKVFGEKRVEIPKEKL